MSDIEAQLKAVVYLSVSTMVEEELQRAGGNTTATPTYVASLVDLVYNQCLNLGEDMESFANHAGRVTINPSDMYMAVRKNPVLKDELQKFESELE
ncbi:Centromere protein S [[Candida] zeylanoides]